MSFTVLIVPDKFKGTLTAQAAAELIREGWREARPADDLQILPMSDGGDGFGEVMSTLWRAEARVVPTLDAAHQPRQGQWWFNLEKQTAIIETAQIIGLSVLPPKKFHPFDLDTFGLGSVFRAVQESQAARCYVGIGGSATNDGGFGLAQALGWTFLGGKDRILERWTDLEFLERIVPQKGSGHASSNSRGSVRPEWIVAVDVQNPLLGPTGASRIYGPQKGLRAEDMSRAEECLSTLVEVVKRDLGLDVAEEPGTGAAGGLGFGLRCFLGARLVSGFDLFARDAGLEERIRTADLVITGEGAIDASTVMGKGVGEVARLCRKHRVPCVGLGGTVTEATARDLVPAQFTQLMGIVPRMTTPELALAEPSYWLPRLAAKAAAEHPKVVSGNSR